MATMKLRDARKKRDITQEQLSAISGVDQSTISALETERMKKPSWEIVAKLAKALEIPPEELFPIDGNGTAA